MPHKIYSCCDRNSCECGNYDKTFDNSNRVFKVRTKPSDKIPLKVEDITDEELREELEKRLKQKLIRIQKDQINTPIYERIKLLEEEVNKLKKKLI